jgi:hypothetical protein
VPFIDDDDPAVRAAREDYDKNKRNGGSRQHQSRACNWRQLIAMPKPIYIIKGVIERGVLAEIYGPTQSGKSFLATDLALHVAFGRSWCSKRVRKGGVLYVSAEGGTAIVRRLEAFAKHHDVKLNDIDFRAVIEPTSLLDHDGADQLIVDAQSVPNLVLVIIDTAARVMPGSREDAEAMGTLVAACDAIRSATRAAVLLVHHTGKNESLGSRGSSVLPSAVDVNISVAQTGETRTVELEKQRDGQTGTICTFRLRVIDLGVDEDGDEVTSCVIEAADAEPKTAKQPKSKLPAAAKIALNTLKKALADSGESVPASNHIPDGMRVVTVEQWRRFHYVGTASDMNTEARKKAFQRARETLQAAGLIGLHADHCWIIR